MNLSHIESTTPIYPQRSCADDDKADKGGSSHEGGGGGGGVYAHSIAQHQPTVAKSKPRYRQKLQVLRKLPATDDAQQRLKRLEQYVHAANALRNRFVQDLTDKVN